MGLAVKWVGWFTGFGVGGGGGGGRGGGWLLNVND